MRDIIKKIKKFNFIYVYMFLFTIASIFFLIYMKELSSKILLYCIILVPLITLCLMIIEATRER